MHRKRVTPTPIIAVRTALIAVTILTAADENRTLSAEKRVRTRRLAELPARLGETPRVLSADEAAQEREALQQFVFRNREMQLGLETAYQLLRMDKLDEALGQIQHVLEHRQDGFLFDRHFAYPIGARQHAQRAFEQLSPATWQRYETLYGPVARRQMNLAVERGDNDALLHVSRNYFYTQAGFDATNRLATWWADRGNFESASRCWDRLFNCRVHAGRIGAIHRVKAALAYRRSGRHERADALLVTPSNIPAMAVRRHKAGYPPILPAVYETTSPAEAVPWPMVMGAPSRVARSEGSSPYLRPRWQHSFFEVQTASNPETDINNRIQRWSEDQQSKGLPVAVAHYPIAVGQQVIVRDRQGIRSLNAQSGETVWSYACQSSLKTAAAASTRERSRRPQWDWLLAGNASWGMLACNQQTVFAIDELELSWNPPSFVGGKAVADPTRGRRKSNRLIALPLESHGDVTAPLWTLGGLETTGKDSNPLSGHFFLGAPLPLHGRLYAVSEYRHQLQLTALNPQDGTVIWTQGIALVDLSIDEDRNRYALPCTPSYAQGILVCPTQLGVIVGVDETTGGLAWIYHYGDPLPHKQFSHMAFRRHPMRGHSGFPDLPVIAGDNVITMPRQSAYVHCFSLNTGERRWRIPRRDAEYIGTVDQGMVLIVGRHKCRGLELDTGAIQWETTTGMCSGRGVQVGDHYVLPLADGAVANLDVATGRKIGLTMLRADGAIGNLAVHNGAIYSMTYDQLTAFPQAAPELEHLRTKIEQQQADATDLLKEGELELILGRPEAAKERLRLALREPMSTESAEAAESLLREALYLQLAAPSTEEPEFLKELRSLAHSPEQRARYLIHKAEFELRHERVAEAIDTALEFVDLELSRPILLTADGGHYVTQASWTPDFLARARQQADTETAAWIHARVAARLRAAIAARDIDSLQRFLENFATSEDAPSARLMLAELQLESGRFQTAELLLQQCRDSEDFDVSAAATWTLANLYADRHLYTKSAALARELSSRFGPHFVAPELNGQQAVLRLGQRDGILGAAVSPQRGTAPITGVSIREDRDAQLELEKVYANFWRPLNVPHDCGFDLRPTGKQRPSGDLWQIHRELGMAVGVLRLPEGAVSPAVGAEDRSFVGHFFPIGSHDGGAMHGVSLLDPAQFTAKEGLEPAEKQVMWTTVAPSQNEHAGPVFPGPAGPGFCAFQTAHQLLVLDPSNGRVRWQRNDIEPGSGLVVDPQNGLFGDENVLVLMSRDKKSFVVYETATGREVYHGTLDIDAAQQRRIFGRNLLHVAQEEGQRYLRLWDPYTDEFLCNDALLKFGSGPTHHNRLSVEVKYSDSFAYFAEDGHAVRVVDGRTGLIELDIPLTKQDAEEIRDIVVFRDDQRLYVNLQRNSRSSWRTNSFASETYLPNVRIHGELRAYRRQTGELMWSRNIPQCVVPHVADFQEPVLVTLSRISWRGRYFLQVAAYHAETGKLLGRRRDILSHRIVQGHYNAGTQTLELQTLKSKISLQLRNQPILDGGAQPLAARR